MSLTRRHTQLDAASLLVVYLVALYAIESRLVVGPLGAGQPATIIGCCGFLWWTYYHLQRSHGAGGSRRPVRIALLVLFAAVLVSFIVAMTRPINGPETSGAQLGATSFVSWMGVGLLANDGVPTRERFEQLARVLVMLTAGLAGLGILQFVTNDAIIHRITIPGLRANVASFGLGTRSGFTRPSGTAIHPIEFGAVLTMILPLTIAWARVGSRSPVLVRWLPTILIGFGIVVSISRSALLSGFAGLLIVGAGLPKAARRAMFVGVVALTATVGFTIPGMLGTFRNMFSSAGDDSSVASRTGSYAIAMQFFDRSPLFGRGYSTFYPSYRIFDNQYLLMLIEMGIVGLGAFLALFVVAGRCARRARKLSDSETIREYGQALVAAVAAGALGLALYDGLSFPMATGVLFVLIGLCGALLRLVVDGDVVVESPTVDLRPGAAPPSVPVKSPAV